MGWRSSGVGLVAVLMFSAGSLRAQEGEAGAPITMPDVRGNVMRMLEESRQQHDSAVSEPPAPSLSPAAEGYEAPVPPPMVAPVAESPPLKEATPEPLQPPPHQASPQSTPSRAARSPKPAASPRRDGHVPLEQKEITIQNLDDVRKLADELKAAKKRQAEQNRAP